MRGLAQCGRAGEAAAKGRKDQALDPMLEQLVKLHDDGLNRSLRPFARANRGMRRLHGVSQNQRDKLRRYLLEHFCPGAEQHDCISADSRG